MSEYETVADIPDSDKWSLVTGAHECNHVLESVGIDVDDYAHGSLFVRVGEADYTDVYFFSGNVPYLQKSVTKIY